MPETWMVAVAVQFELAPSLSVTVSATVNVPELVKVWDGVAPVAVPPSPKSHAYDAIVPSGSDEPVPSNATAWPTRPEYGPPASHTGGRFEVPMLAVVVQLELAPSSSVTVSVTVKAPALV